MSQKLNLNLAEMDEEMDVDDELADHETEQQETSENSNNKETDEAKRSKKDKSDKTNQTNNSKVKAKLPPKVNVVELPESTRKDKTLREVLDMVNDEYAPIIPDAVTDFYLAKNGLQCPDLKIKRVLALATQKFISDIATDAYQYSRIRSLSSVYNSANPQARARALVSGQAAAAGNASGGGGGGGAAAGGATGGGGGSGNKQEKIVLTSEDLSSALSEYGLNINRPDFYR